MIRRTIQWVAWSVFGLSLAAWRASYFESSWVNIPGGHGLLLDAGAIYPSPGATVTGWSMNGAIPQRLGSAQIFSRDDVILPLWLPCMLLVAALWAVWRFEFERRQLAMVGCCAACGYNLTGIDGVCPECGRKP